MDPYSDQAAHSQEAAYQLQQQQQQQQQQYQYQQQPHSRLTTPTGHTYAVYTADQLGSFYSQGSVMAQPPAWMNSSAVVHSQPTDPEAKPSWWQKFRGKLDNSFNGMDLDLFKGIIATIVPDDGPEHYTRYETHLQQVQAQASIIAQGDMWWWLYLMLVVFPHLVTTCLFSLLTQLTRVTTPLSPGLADAFAFGSSIAMICSVGFLALFVLGDLSTANWAKVILRWHYFVTVLQVVAIYCTSGFIPPLSSFAVALSIAVVHIIALTVVSVYASKRPQIYAKR